MRIRLLILTLLIIGVHQHIQAQYMLGTTGMMNMTPLKFLKHLAQQSRILVRKSAELLILSKTFKLR